jgi:hypothetical protein
MDGADIAFIIQRTGLYEIEGMKPIVFHHPGNGPYVTAIFRFNKNDDKLRNNPSRSMIVFSNSF